MRVGCGRGRFPQPASTASRSSAAAPTAIRRSTTNSRSASNRLVVHEASLRGTMGQWPAEIHFDVNDLLVANSENLGIAKSMAVRIAPLIRHEHTLAV